MKCDDNFKINFVGIGFPKCATTWVYKCLLEHPQICGPYRKELNFFISDNGVFEETARKESPLLYGRGLDFYKTYFSHCPADSIKGEFSVAYVLDPGSGMLIKKHFPEAKIIVCLRDPVKKAYSEYWYRRKFRLKDDGDTFEEAINRKPDIYLDNNMYYKLLKPFFEIFPRENIGVFFIDDLKKDPVRFIRDIYKFLGVSGDFIPPSAIKKENASKKARFSFLHRLLINIWIVTKIFRKLKLYFVIDFLRKMKFDNLVVYLKRINATPFHKPPINPQTEKYLKSVFKKDVEMLEKFVERDLSGWKSV